MKGMNANLDFKLGQPFRPFEQLMGVLPDRSKKIVPAVYHELMTEAKSPIIDFYPRDFKLDMNGKKMEWEAVVKIPFIDEKRLLSAMAPKNELLTPEEKARNDFGVSLKFTYDPNLDFIYPSSMVGIFPDIPHCRCVENIFDLPTTEGLELYVGLLDNAKLGVDALAGFPSLATLPYNANLGFHEVNVFQQVSRNESMVVTLADVELRSKVGLAKAKIGQRCHVGYPFLQEARIVRVSDELFDYSLASDGSGQVIPTHHSGKDIGEWSKKASRIENFYSKRLGIIIGPVESLVHVEMLKGLTKTDEGATVKEYGLIPGMEIDYAAQVIVDRVVSEDERFIERDALPFEEEFPVGSHVFFLGDYGYGRPLEICSHNDNRAEIILSVPVAREPDFARSIIRIAEQQSGYQPSYVIAKELGLHPLVLSKITSSFFVHTIGGSMKVNLGLNLKFEARKQKVLGYSRKSNSGWEFSPAAVRLLVEYMTRFPDFFAAIMRNPSGNEFHETDLWPDTQAASTRTKEIGAWLKTVETSKFERVPLDAEQLDSNVVMELQRTVDSLRESAEQTEPKRLKGVPRSALLNPRDAEQRLSNQRFALGDRVVYVQASGKVPIASRGTVVGISTVGNHHMLDVLCDNAFMNGTTLAGRCEPFRGQTVSANSVLNVSNRQVITSSKKSKEKQPSSTEAPLSSLGYGAPGGRGGKLRDAPTPGPLRGSWRGVANGANRQSAQGRGAHNSHTSNDIPHLQPSSLVYRPMPNQPQTSNPGATQQIGGQSYRGRGGPHWNGRGNRGGRGASISPGNDFYGSRGPEPTGPIHHQSYNAMPPPAGLNARGGGGRGRSRGRGGVRGRGVRGTPTGN